MTSKLVSDFSPFHFFPLVFMTSDILFIYLFSFGPWQNCRPDMCSWEAHRSGFIFVDRLYLPDTSRPSFRQQSGMIFCQEEQLLNLLFAFTLAQRNPLQYTFFFCHGFSSRAEIFLHHYAGSWGSPIKHDLLYAGPIIGAAGTKWKYLFLWRLRFAAKISQILKLYIKFIINFIFLW